jgi:hypothetical protein
MKKWAGPLGFLGVGLLLALVPWLKTVLGFPTFYLIFLYFTFFWVAQALQRHVGGEEVHVDVVVLTHCWRAAVLTARTRRSGDATRDLCPQGLRDGECVNR